MRGKKGVLPRYRPGPSLSSRPGHGLAWSRTASAYLGQALPLLPQLLTCASPQWGREGSARTNLMGGRQSVTCRLLGPRAAGSFSDVAAAAAAAAVSARRAGGRVQTAD